MKITIKKIGLVCALALQGVMLFAQNNRQYKVPANNIFSDDSKPGWYYIKNDLVVSESEIFTTYKAAFGLSASDEMKLLKVNTDQQGFTHSKYQQYFKGLPVEGTMLIVHANNSKNVQFVNGQVIRNLNLPSRAMVNEKAAIKTALSTLPAKKYLWEELGFENRKKVADKNSAATNFPKGKLCIFPATGNENLLTGDFRMGWQFDIYVLIGNKSSRVFVDATDGRVKRTILLGKECNTGTANASLNGNQNVYTSKVGNNYVLLNDCQTTKIHTYDLINDSIADNKLEFSDADNNWDAFSQRSPVQTHFGASRTYQYYKNILGRSSWDNANGEMTAYHGFKGSEYANACWGCFPDAAIFGIGPSGASNNDDWNSLDIVGHEFTHGVVQAEAGLTYYAQSGALNESFADIFGDMVEKDVEGFTDGTSSWLVGEDRGGAIRSFWNPNAASDPANYKGAYWFNTDTCSGQEAKDNCGVHTNSGVQNHWFYLLSVGGTATNENGEKFTVAGIGSTKASLIAYDNLANYLTPSSTYLDARNGAIQAAIGRYGTCSNEMIQTAKAWFAVGADVESVFYNKNLSCFNITTSGSQIVHAGIRSLTLQNTPCIPLSTATANVGNITLKASKLVDLKAGVEIKASGTNAVYIFTDDCAAATF
ncbi:MAG: M4 family metallopeptidase [Bacteroidota bacterium]